jgi:glycosyltransferase involved in cell wall biosynthesis/2-polyprenyl-3-methyl-5-hydroxy-6-metoxy-1,4-benzoquinol methylase
MDTNGKKRKVLIFIVAYNAERTIRDVIRRIPASLLEHDTEILVIDDSSRDRTFDVAREFANEGGLRFPVTVLVNPVNQGYGGNQKIGFLYAIRKKFDVVALLHGDGQYAPEFLPELLKPLAAGEADAVFGSRMISRLGALKGRMPLYKYIGNRILTRIQNLLLRSGLSEFHSGYRLYSVGALERIPFERNTHDFHFDTEITIQLLRARLRIKELPIPTYYGDEISYVNVMRYGLNVLRSSFLARAQDFGIFYERKFDVSHASTGNPLYQAKLEFESPHTLALARVAPGSAVLDVGCASGYVSRALRLKRCSVTGIDQVPPSSHSMLDRFIRHDLDEGVFPVNVGMFDYILLLDVIEHLRSPEAFIDLLRNSREEGRKDTQLIVSTGNVAFVITRLMLLLGFFNYGVRGILDLTHKRLFTFSTFRKLFEQAGYRIEEVKGVPAPFPLALSNTAVAQFLLALNKMLIKVSRSVFSYQIFMVVRPLPSVDWLLERAIETSQERPLEDPALARLSPGDRKGARME